VDRLLTSVLADLTRAPCAAAVERWFFVRYGDPGWHLRVRFRGLRAALLGELLPELHDRCAPLLREGALARVQLDTYQREIERYGGPEAMPFAEDIFFRDSQAVLGILELLEGDEGADARWRLTLRGMHDLLLDFGLCLDARLALVERLRADFGREHAVDAKVERALGERFRLERADIAALLVTSADAEHPLSTALAFIARRSAAVRPSIEALDRTLAPGARSGVIASLLHMHANRLLLSQQRSQELVLYDFLARHYRSELARARGRGQPARARGDEQRSVSAQHPARPGGRA
jgi:thiopeptide-type bacteriocin biosynthesis protein